MEYKFLKSNPSSSDQVTPLAKRDRLKVLIARLVTCMLASLPQFFSSPFSLGGNFLFKIMVINHSVRSTRSVFSQNAAAAVFHSFSEARAGAARAAHILTGWMS